MWFSNPLDFNDPYDFQIVDAGQYSIQEITAHLNRANASNGNILSATQIQAAATFYHSNQNSLSQLIDSEKLNMFSKKGCLCLAKDWDNILMWSHYAESHKGFAIEMDLTKDPDFFLRPINVVYSSSHPVSRYLVDRDIVTKCIQTKFDVWNYEREVRIFKMTTGAVKFNPDAITKIIFGANTSPLDEMAIRNSAAKGGHNSAKFYRAQKSATTFQLNLVRA